MLSSTFNHGLNTQVRLVLVYRYKACNQRLLCDSILILTMILLIKEKLHTQVDLNKVTIFLRNSNCKKCDNRLLSIH